MGRKPSLKVVNMVAHMDADCSYHPALSQKVVSAWRKCAMGKTQQQIIVHPVT